MYSASMFLPGVRGQLQAQPLPLVRVSRHAKTMNSVGSIGSTVRKRSKNRENSLPKISSSLTTIAETIPDLVCPIRSPSPSFCLLPSDNKNQTPPSSPLWIAPHVTLKVSVYRN